MFKGILLTCTGFGEDVKGCIPINKSIAKIVLAYAIIINILFIPIIVNSFSSINFSVVLAKEDTPMSYADINAHQWFYNTVKKAYELKIIDNSNGNEFKPYEPIKTIDFIRLLMKAAKVKTTEEDFQTDDALLAAAVKYSVIDGQDVYSYREPILKREAAKMAAGLLRLDTSIGTSVFDDTQDRYAEALYREYILRPLSLEGKLSFHPEQSMTKSEALTLIINAIEYMKAPQEFKAVRESRLEEVKFPILMYHSISEDAANWNACTVSPEKFESDIMELKAENYSFIGFDDLIAYADGYAELPAKPLIITFDDGYEDNYKYAFASAGKYNAKIVISIIGAKVERSTGLYSNSENSLSPEQITEMAGSGLVEFQNHTYDMHLKPGDPTGMNQYKDEDDAEYINRIQFDLPKCSRLIKNLTGRESQMICYPGGLYKSITEEWIKKMGFRGSISVKPGINNIKDGLYSLKRINVPYDLTSKELLELIENYK